MVSEMVQNKRIDRGWLCAGSGITQALHTAPMDPLGGVRTAVRKKQVFIRAMQVFGWAFDIMKIVRLPSAGKLSDAGALYIHVGKEYLEQ